MTRLAASLLAASLASCSPPRFDLSKPVRVVADQPAPDEFGVVLYQASDIAGYLRDGVLALGGSVSDSARQEVRFRPALTAEELSGCGVTDQGLTAAYEYLGQVYACPAFVATFSLARQVYVTHELGHVLGAGHLPCSAGAVMSAPPDPCYDPRLATRGVLTDADAADVCGTGLTVGGVCDSFRVR